MKVFQIRFDASSIVMIVENKQEVYDKLTGLEGENFIYDGKKLYYEWNEDFKEECEIINLTSKRGIIQWESN